MKQADCKGGALCLWHLDLYAHLVSDHLNYDTTCDHVQLVLLVRAPVTIFLNRWPV